MLRAIVALGNPGSAYADTRHNAGFILSDFLTREWQLPRFRKVGRTLATDGTVLGEHVVVIKPQTYMNRSGTALGPLLDLDGFDLSQQMLVLVDDWALRLGTFRIRAKGSSGGHNGLQSVEDFFATRDYARLRIGVGPLPDDHIDPADFVLSSFQKSDVSVVSELLPIMAEAVECWIETDVETTMNRFNRKEPPPE